MEHQHLTIASRAGTDADRGDVDGVGDHRTDLLGHALDDEREASGMLEGLGVIDEGQRRIVLTTLDPETAHGVDRLRGQTDMAHDRDLGVDEGLDHRDALTTALELDALGTGPDECRGVAHRVLDRDVVAEPRHVGDDQRRGRGPGHRCRVMRHIGHRDLQGVVVAEHDHGDGIADQDEIDAGGIGHARTRCVIGGDHHQWDIATADLATLDRRHGGTCAHWSLLNRPAPRWLPAEIPTLAVDPISGKAPAA